MSAVDLGDGVEEGDLVVVADKVGGKEFEVGEGVLGELEDEFGGLEGEHVFDGVGDLVEDAESLGHEETVGGVFVIVDVEVGSVGLEILGGSEKSLIDNFVWDFITVTET